MTGLSAISDDPGKFTKGLALLAEAVPMASRFAVLMGPNNSLHAQILKGAVGAAARLHISILPAEKRTPDDIDSAFATMATNEIQAVAVLSDPVEFANRRMIIELAAKHRIPAMYTWRVEAVEGGLFAYGPDIADLNRRAAGYVVKLLQGAKAGELPIEQAERFRLVINLKTAKALGLIVPPTLLATADEVIE